MDEDEQDEGREMSESITKELRDCIFDCPHLKGVADRIDARFDRELTAKREEVDGLKADNEALRAKIDEWEKLASKQTDTILKSEHRCQAMQAKLDAAESDNSVLRTECTDLRGKLDASIWMALDADGVKWTLTETEFIDENGCAQTGDFVIQNGKIYLSIPCKMGLHELNKCRHVAPEQPDSQERIDADAGTIEDGMLDGAFEYCMDHGIEVTTDSADSYIYARAYGDLLRRQRELDGAGEQA